jgi:hypothetical protein
MWGYWSTKLSKGLLSPTKCILDPSKHMILVHHKSKKAQIRCMPHWVLHRSPPIRRKCHRYSRLAILSYHICKGYSGRQSGCPELMLYQPLVLLWEPTVGMDRWVSFSFSFPIFLFIVFFESACSHGRFLLHGSGSDPLMVPSQLLLPYLISKQIHTSLSLFPKQTWKTKPNQTLDRTC